jgi:hypothetical protein
MPDAAFLGPQYREPNLRHCLDAMGVSGPLVAITTGWQEREGEIDELRAHVGGEVRDLGLYERAQHVYADDPELARAYRERQDVLQEMQDHYRLRLAGLKAVVEQMNAVEGDSAPLRLARRAALGDVRRLDRQHVAALVREHASFTRRWHPARRASLVPHVAELKRTLDHAAAVLVAGGHVAVLLNRMRLFGMGTLLRGKPLVAWSAGAMAVSDRVVLFHDRTPQGVQPAEVLDVGLGLVPNVVALPHADSRMALDEPPRVRSFSRRFAPATCLVLGHGALARWHRGRLVEVAGLRRLVRSGTVVDVRAEVRT